MMIDVYEIAGRLQNENTPERRYRNHLRDVGLYDGPVEMGRIRFQRLQNAINTVEGIVHVTYHVDTAVSLLGPLVRGLRQNEYFTPRDSVYDAIDGIYRARTELQQHRITHGERAVLEKARHLAQRANQATLPMKYTSGRKYDRATLGDMLRTDLERVLSEMALPAGDVMREKMPVYDSAVARRMVRAGRFVLRDYRAELREKRPARARVQYTGGSPCW